MRETASSQTCLLKRTDNFHAEEGEARKPLPLSVPIYYSDSPSASSAGNSHFLYLFSMARASSLVGTFPRHFSFWRRFSGQYPSCTQLGPDPRKRSGAAFTQSLRILLARSRISSWALRQQRMENQSLRAWAFMPMMALNSVAWGLRYLRSCSGRCASSTHREA